VVNREGVYVGANRAARRFLQFSATLQGEHFDKLPCAAWMPEVVAKLKVAFATSQPCSFDLCPSSGPMEGRNISVNLQPLLKEVQELQGMVITFHETEAKAAVFEPQLLQNN
jgi:hypothetical protein